MKRCNYWKYWFLAWPSNASHLGSIEIHGIDFFKVKLPARCYHSERTDNSKWGTTERLRFDTIMWMEQERLKWGDIGKLACLGQGRVLEDDVLWRTAFYVWVSQMVGSGESITLKCCASIIGEFSPYVQSCPMWMCQGDRHRQWF